MPVAKWPAAGQGFKITKWPEVWYFSQILTNRRNPSNSEYHMSIKNCQAIQKRSLTVGLHSAQRARPWLATLRIFLDRLPVKGFKSLNDRQSDIFLKF